MERDTRKKWLARLNKKKVAVALELIMIRRAIAKYKKTIKNKNK